MAKGHAGCGAEPCACVEKERTQQSGTQTLARERSLNVWELGLDHAWALAGLESCLVARDGMLRRRPGCMHGDGGLVCNKEVGAGARGARPRGTRKEEANWPVAVW